MTTHRVCSRGHHELPVSGVCPSCKRDAEERQHEKEPSPKEMSLDTTNPTSTIKVK